MPFLFIRKCAYSQYCSDQINCNGHASRSPAILHRYHLHKTTLTLLTISATPGLEETCCQGAFLINRRKQWWTLLGKPEEHVKALYWNNLNEHFCYKTFTLKAMKVSIHEKYYSFILHACKWHSLHLVSLYKHVNVSLSLF